MMKNSVSANFSLFVYVNDSNNDLNGFQGCEIANFACEKFSSVCEHEKS